MHVLNTTTVVIPALYIDVPSPRILGIKCNAGSRLRGGGGTEKQAATIGGALQNTERAHALPASIYLYISVQYIIYLITRYFPSTSRETRYIYISILIHTHTHARRRLFYEYIYIYTVYMYIPATRVVTAVDVYYFFFLSLFYFFPFNVGEKKNVRVCVIVCVCIDVCKMRNAARAHATGDEERLTAAAAGASGGSRQRRWWLCARTRWGHDAAPGGREEEEGRRGGREQPRDPRVSCVCTRYMYRCRCMRI